MISFIHLSDIHFKQERNVPYDLDKDIRNEILRDLKENAKGALTNVAGILVCGDIAFSGKRQEYKAAEDFLSELCEIFCIPVTSVFCIPGNHDVDQLITRKSVILTDTQNNLLAISNQHKLNEKLNKIVNDPIYKDFMFTHIKAYNQYFASKFSCNISRKKPTWTQNLDFEKGYEINITGLNSTLISNHLDHISENEEKSMIIGEFQLPNRKDNTINLTLCHHPPKNLSDYSNIKDRLNARVAVQLYGHEHIQTISQDDKSLIIGCGAMQPERTEDWYPSYNWVSLSLTEDENKVSLVTRVYARALNQEKDSFKQKGDNFFEDYVVTIKNKTNEVALSTSGSEINKKNAEPDVKIIEQSTKELVYAFLKLSWGKRSRILKELELIADPKPGVDHTCIIDEILNRAQELDVMQKFVDKVYSTK